VASAKTQLVAWTRCRGRNGWDGVHDIPPDQAAEALNVHFYNGGIGTKRGGSISTGTLSSFTGAVFAMASWVPGQDMTGRELFAVIGNSPAQIGRMAAGSTMAVLTLKDAIEQNLQEITFAAINGKLFIAYDSLVNRLQVFDPDLSTTTVRRAGLPDAAAPTVADTGSGTYAATIRYYRIAFTEQRSGVTVRRGELGTVEDFTPSGTGTHARITKPTAASEGETHWEIYASPDNELFYGPIATVVVGTTTYDDNETVANYALDYDLSPTEGANLPFPSTRYVYSNGVRLFGFGVWESAAGDSHTPQDGTVYFTPALDSSEVHDEERCQDTVNAKGKILLARNAGGRDRALTGFGNVIAAFQAQGVYALVPTENADLPYRRVQYSNTVGAVSNQSTISAEDELGRPCVYFLDPVRGPYRLGHDGLKWCGKDVKDLWDTVNLDATGINAHGVYFERKRQIWFWIATGASQNPDTMLILDVTEQHADEDGDLRGGWSKWTGTLATCRSSCMMATTLGATMSIGLSPYAGSSSTNVIYKADTTDADDAGTDFQAYVESGAVALAPPHINKALVKSHLLAKAQSGTTITQTLIRNYGDETNRTSTVSLTAVGSETHVQRKFEDAAVQDAFLFQVRLGDPAASEQKWQLDHWYGVVEGNEER
jgi:hypothetical protein